MTGTKNCSNGLKLLGDYWTLRIIDQLSIDGPSRFCALQRSLDDLNPVTLTNRLKKLEEALLVERAEKVIGDNSVIYSLTPLGWQALPIVKAIGNFAKVQSYLPPSQKVG